MLKIQCYKCRSFVAELFQHGADLDARKSSYLEARGFLVCCASINDDLEPAFPNFPLANYYVKSDDWFICKQCNKKYKHRTSVWRHIKWECNKKPQFACHICGKRVTQKTSLKAHVENVHGIMPTPYHAYQLLLGPFPCATCGKFYKYKTSLNKHIKYECNKEPRFLCTICKKRFFQKIHLKKHLMSSVHRKLPLDVELTYEHK
ncbi:hypothetical protein HUJ04_008551 [Dendroctonus ponderosae]|nr:hypothetical protein HUJ04_008551 [Dendroctonus ponderosae]